jgi:hypothetical protein
MRRALVVAIVCAAAAQADPKHPNPFLSQAKSFFSQGDGEKCLKRLIQAGEKWKHNDKRDRAEIELYGGMCGYLTGEQQAAEVSFQRALKVDPKITLPPDAGAGIENLWAKVTGKPVVASATAAADKPKKDDAKPKKDEPAPASQPPPQKKVAAVEDPFGPSGSPPPPQPYVAPVATAPVATETQESEAKPGRSFLVPIILGVGAVGAGIGGTLLGVQAKGLQTTYNSAMTFQSDADRIKPQAQNEALIANICFAAAGALVIGALAMILFGS